jgi:hypothetical protein
MNHQQKMAEYLDLVARTQEHLDAIKLVIRREVMRRYGRKILAARTKQEQDNLREHFTVAVTKENIWHRSYKGDRDFYISMATMHGIAALVERNQ